MAKLTIVLGNKNYSSWSLRPWMALEATGAPYEEIIIALDQPDTAEKIRRYSPAGRVPVLFDGDTAIWDSLAICEYLAEKFPQAHLWPADQQARARARSVSAEMHSGFAQLRDKMPMKMSQSLPGVGHTPEALADAARVQEIWRDCRRQFGHDGPYLFGRFSIADCMYAPVVSRFATYGVGVDGEAGEYYRTMMSHPSYQKWLAAAKAEPFKMARYER